MNIKELLEYHQGFCEQARVIMEQKNHDYSGASGTTPFANFEIVSKLGIASTEQGFLVRIMDKMMRLSTFVSAGELKVENESVQDACMDVVNYMILLAAYMKSKKVQDSMMSKILGQTTPEKPQWAKQEYEFIHGPGTYPFKQKEIDYYV